MREAMLQLGRPAHCRPPRSRIYAVVSKPYPAIRPQKPAYAVVSCPKTTAGRERSADRCNTSALHQRIWLSTQVLEWRLAALRARAARQRHGAARPRVRRRHASAEGRHRLAGQAGATGHWRLGGGLRQAREVRVRAVLLYPPPASGFGTQSQLQSRVTYTTWLRGRHR